MANSLRRIRLAGGVAAVVVLAGATILAAIAGAAPGDFDASFGGDGIVTTNLGGDDVIRGAAVQADGKLVVAGYTDDSTLSRFAVARYLANGGLDTSFAGDGIQVTSFTVDAFGRAVLVQPDGKIVVAGSVSGTTTSDFAVARYNLNGTVDTSFSDDGKLTTDFGGALDQVWAVARQTDGKLVVAGSSGSSSTQDFALARYEVDGSLDATFSGDGMTTTDLGGGDSARALVIQANGGIVAAGAAGSMYQRDFGLARYLTDGSLDTTFSGDGKQVTSIGELDYINAAALQGDGRIVVAGYTDTQTVYDFALARYTTAGSLDTTFDGDGIQTTDLGGQDYGDGVVLQPNGRIVVAGSSGNDFGLARYSSTGILDTTFSTDGKLTTNLGGGDTAYDVELQPDGKILAVGESADDAALVRYHGDDVTPPQTSIDSGPSGTTNDATPTFTFSSSEAGSSFECHMDGAPFAACSSPYTTATLGQGAHTFEARATDAAGNTDATPASRVFTVDTIAPQTTIDSGPGALTNDATPTFTFSSSEAGAGFQYRIDGGAFYACSSPHTTGPLVDGLHTFEVGAVDEAGNVDPVPASRSFTVDAHAPFAPVLTDVDPDSPANHNAPRLKGSAEPGSTVRLYGSSACTGPALAEGPAADLGNLGIQAQVPNDSTTSFFATATDAAGNRSACSTREVLYAEDSTAPQTTIDSPPHGTTTDSTPTFSFSAGEPGSRLECSADNGPFAPCGSPLTIGPLAVGAHAFAVRAQDVAGNVDATPATESFVVETPTRETKRDTTVSVTLSAKKTQRLGSAFTLAVRCLTEPCTVVATGKLTVPVGRRARAFQLARVSSKLAAAKLTTIKLKPSAKARRAALLALRRRKPVRAKLTVTATDAAGNRDAKTVTIALRR